MKNNLIILFIFVCFLLWKFPNFDKTREQCNVPAFSRPPQSPCDGPPGFLYTPSHSHSPHCAILSKSTHLLIKIWLFGVGRVIGQSFNKVFMKKEEKTEIKKYLLGIKNRGFKISCEYYNTMQIILKI